MQSLALFTMSRLAVMRDELISPHIVGFVLLRTKIIAYSKKKCEVLIDTTASTHIVHVSYKEISGEEYRQHLYRRRSEGEKQTTLSPSKLKSFRGPLTFVKIVCWASSITK